MTGITIQGKSIRHLHLSAFMLLVMLLSHSIVFSQPTFQRLYGTLDNDAGSSITPCFSGGYLVSGTTTNYFYGDPEIYLVRITEYGDTLWTRSVSHPSDYDWNKGVYEHTDHSFLLGNCFYGDTATTLLLKYNDSGDKIWSKSFTFDDDAFFCSLASATDTGIVICGYHGQSFPSVFMIKTDNQGDEVWRRSYGGSFMEGYFPEQMINTADNAYIICGSVTIGGTELNKGLLIKTDSSGILSWTKQYESASYYKRYFTAIQQYSDGSYYITGYDTWSNYFSADYPFLMKTDPQGNLAWLKYYDQPHPYRTLSFTAGGNILLAGAYNDTAMIAQADPEGTITWSANIVSKYAGSYISQVIAAADGGYIMAGKAAYHGGFGGDDVLIMKANQYGIITEMQGTGTKVESAEVSAWPNPCRDKTGIFSKYPVQSVTVYDARGLCLYTNKQEICGSNSFPVSTAAFPAGMLIFRIETSGGVFIKKIIKQ
ncbi:MAG: T9SS type A sorting domain-containing protein [Bacteroidota bacterium]